jgi:hypothetical protein
MHVHVPLALFVRCQCEHDDNSCQSWAQILPKLVVKLGLLSLLATPGHRGAPNHVPPPSTLPFHDLDNVGVDDNRQSVVDALNLQKEACRFGHKR